MKGDKFGAAALGLAALVMFGLGALGLFSPLTVIGPIGLSASGASAMNELRAQYGGLHLALAAYYGWGIVKPEGRRMALGVLVVQMTGIVLARAASSVIDGVPGPAVCKPWTLEALLLVLGMVALARKRPSPE
jgi:hypothetical protein